MIVQTRNTRYVLRDMGDGGFLISGSQKYCPAPTPCVLLSPPVVGRSMWFHRIEDRPTRVVITSTVLEVTDVA